MRLATIILFACAACALQLHHAEPVLGRRSFRPISQKRLASRRIGPDIVPRGNEIPKKETIEEAQCSYNSLHMLMSAIAGGHITMLKGDQRSPVKVYRLNHPYGFDGKPAVVKEIHPERAQWTQAAMELEVRNLRDVDQLLAALFNGETFFIIMKDLGGERTSVERPRGAEAIQLMKAATELYSKNYGLQRDFEKYLKRRPARNDFTWTLEKGSWKVVPVGGWRYAESTGHAEITVPKDRHYCGIKGWQNDLPIFEMLGRAHVSATVHHTGGYTLRAAARVTV